MKRVSILTHSFLDGYNRRFTKIFGGGLERYLYDLCTVIKEMNLQPEVHQLSYFEAFETTIEGIKVYGYPYEFDRVSDAFEIMAEKATGPLIYASCIWHPIKYKPGSLGICHGINWDQSSMPKEEKQYIADNIQGALTSLSRIVSVDSHFLTFTRSVCSYPDPERVILLPNAVDTDYFKPKRSKNTSGQIKILYPRRISYERGIIPMMLIADYLLAEYPHVLFEFAGELVDRSPIGDTFTIWMKNHQHKERIIHQTYPFDKVVEAYRRADVTVIPTIFSEGTSYSCLEALSCGTAVVSSNVGGLNDLIINGYNGLLASPTEEGLLKAIRQVVEDEKLRKSLGKHARQTAFAFDKKIWMKRWREILENYIT